MGQRQACPTLVLQVFVMAITGSVALPAALCCLPGAGSSRYAAYASL